MARIIINAGNFNVSIQSGVKLDQYKRLAEEAPEKLGLYNEDGDCTFMVMLSATESSKVAADFVKFSCKPDSDGNAVASISIPEGVESVREYVAKHYRKVIANLNSIEAAIPAAILNLENEYQAAYDSMEVIGL